MQSLLARFKSVLQLNSIDFKKAAEEWSKLKADVSIKPANKRNPEVWEEVFAAEEEGHKNILLLLTVLLVLPMSTAVVERGFSAMKRIKSDWRSRLSPEQLSKLMFISIQGPLSEEYDPTIAIKSWWNSDRKLE